MNPPSPGRPRNSAIVRGLVWWSPAGPGFLVPLLGTLLPFVFVPLNGLWALWGRPNRQSLNDKVAKTVVVADR